MDDLRTLIAIAARHKRLLIGLAILAALAARYPEAEIEFVEISPDKSYRLEHWWPGLLPALYYRHIRNMESPGFDRLYSNHDNTYFGESPVLDHFGGKQTFWHMDIDRTVSINAEFTFPNIPPEQEPSKKIEQ